MRPGSFALSWTRSLWTAHARDDNPCKLVSSKCQGTHIRSCEEISLEDVIRWYNPVNAAQLLASFFFFTPLHWSSDRILLARPYGFLISYWWTETYWLFSKLLRFHTRWYVIITKENSHFGKKYSARLDGFPWFGVKFDSFHEFWLILFRSR